LNTGGNQSHGAGGIVLNRSGNQLYTWAQYGWSAGNVNSWVTRFDVSADGTLNPLETSFTSWRRDPFDTPLFLDGAERWVFNKQQMFAATNVSVLINQFGNNIYGISLDGSIAFGPTEVFNTVNGNTLTNLPFSTTVQTLSGDQKKLFRYQSSTTNIVIYDMATIASVSGPTPAPTPADGAVVSLPLTNLSWTVSPLALAYDVYFGTNQSQVAAATNGSALYLGRITAPPQSLPGQLAPGVTYYWRLDVVGFSATNSGPVWSFTTSTLSVNPAQINYSAIAGYNPASISLVLTGALPVAWSAAVSGANWLSISPTSGTSPGTVTVTFNTTALAAGQYTNNINFTVGASTLTVPVSLSVKALNITKMVADPQRPYLYAIQPPALSGQSGLLLFINTTNGNIDKSLTIGINPVDLSVNRAENKLYIASWTETWTYVVDLQTQTLLPSLNLGTDVYKINAGRQGRVISEGMDQWVYMTLFNTTNGASLASGFVREGDGDFDPTGRYYYHVDNNSSGAAISKFDTITDSFVGVTNSGTRGSYYGSRNLVISADGSRLFWTRVVFDADLVSYDMVPGEVYSCSTNGRVAFGAAQAYDSQTRQLIYNLPASTTVSVVDGQNQRFWYFANGTLASIPMIAIQSPTITTQPAANTSVTTGGSVYLTVTAMGISPLSYQWTLGGTNLSGETNYFLSILSLQPSQAGDYRVVVANPFGAVTSSVAQVNVLIPPSIVIQPLGTNVAGGQSFSLSVTAAGTAPFVYRWLFENSTIAGAIAPSLTVNNAQSVNEGIYRAVVNNSVGSVTSAAVFVRVLPAAPVIVSNPAPVVAGASSNATFTVQAIGSQPLAYQWLFNGTPIAGALGAQYSLTGVQSSNAGSYQVVVSNSIGTAASTPATLTVLPVAPYFTVNPVGATLAAGSSRTFTGLANGSQPIGYQWQRNGTNLPGATATSLALTSLTIADSGAYGLRASNIGGASTSAVVQLTIYQNATLLSALSNQVVQVSDTVVLAVSAAGTQPLGYTWQVNGQPITGSDPVLVLSNIQPAQSGFYRVIVTNQYGSVSSTGRVSVLGVPSAVVAWGDNSGAQTNVPPGLGDIVAVAGGDYHSIALRRNGTLLAWGYNGDGQTTVPTNALRLVAIAAGGAHNLAITENGGAIGWGRNDYGQRTVPASASNNVLSIAAGDAHSLALLSGGTVVAWGDNTLGQLSVPQSLTTVRAIAAGHNHSLALRTNGTVVGWGFNLYGQTTPPAALTNAIAVAGGYLHSAALRADGTVVCWGDNTYGQTNVPAGLSNVVAIAAGDFHTYARQSNGAIIGWGDDEYGQLSVPASATNSYAVSSGFFHGLALVPALSFSARLSPEGMIVEWTGDGMLQWAPTPFGPFTDMPGYSRAYTNANMTSPARFFRLRR
jgi:alpha-tubulin suppressor-like RCC1 family protein